MLQRLRCWFGFHPSLQVSLNGLKQDWRCGECGWDFFDA